MIHDQKEVFSRRAVIVFQPSIVFTEPLLFDRQSYTQIYYIAMVTDNQYQLSAQTFTHVVLIGILSQNISTDMHAVADHTHFSGLSKRLELTFVD